MKRDTLARHQKNYQEYEQRYNASVSLLHCTVRELENLGANIDEELAAIDAHMNELSQTRDQIAASRDRNGRVVQNFKNLLCIE